MKKLGRRNYDLITEGVKTLGTYNPDEILFIFEEQLYVDEIDEIIEFLNWVHINKKMFGHGNYEEIFKEFKESKK